MTTEHSPGQAERPLRVAILSAIRHGAYLAPAFAARSHTAWAWALLFPPLKISAS